MSQLKSALAAFRRILSTDISATQNDHADIRWLFDQIKNMTPGALDVAIERSRQIGEKGYDQVHDDKLPERRLVEMAIDRILGGDGWRDGHERMNDFKCAAALLIAEYDRLGRLKAGGE